MTMPKKRIRKIQRAGETQVLRLTAADQVRFARALIAPAPPTPALRRAFARRRALLAKT
jgi:uncharacterized protein (DUF1778 family)